MKINQKYIIVTLCVILGAVLYFSGCNTETGKTNAKAEKPDMEKAATANKVFSFSNYETDFLTKAPAEVKKQIQPLLEELSQRKNDSSLIRKVAMAYQKVEMPILSGYYYKMLADMAPNNAQLQAITGKMFFESQPFFSGSQELGYFVDESMAYLKKAIDLNPKDFVSKADLAANYIEGKNQVMQGVGLLKEIIQVDSLNKTALLYLGVLSMQSGQFDKAKKRFELLTKTYPDNPDYYRYLGESLLKLEDKTNAKAAFVKYKNMINDSRLKAEISKIINNIN